MSHNILDKDTCVTTEKTWHGLEKIEAEIGYDNSGLDWTVENQPMLLESTGQKIPGHYAVYCPEKDEVINVAKESYTIIQNSQLFEVIEDAFCGIGHKIVSAGSLGSLKKVYISVQLTDHQEYLVNGDTFKNYICFVTSHDGSMNLEAYDSSLRPICQNTLQWSRKDKGILNLRVRHTKNSQVKIENMKQQIDKLFEKRLEFYSSFEALMSRPMSLDRAEQILIGFEAAEELSTRAENKVAIIKDLFVNGRGNKGETYADLLNGVTEYYTSQCSPNAAKAFASSEFGLAGAKKLKFWGAINDDDMLDELARRGEALLLAGV